MKNIRPLLSVAAACCVLALTINTYAAVVFEDKLEAVALLLEHNAAPLAVDPMGEELRRPHDPRLCTAWAWC